MKFTVYSKDGCPFCSKIKAILEQRNFDHVVYELNGDFTKEEFYAEFGEGSTFPQIILDGNKLGGCVDTVKYLSDNNLI